LRRLAERFGVRSGYGLLRPVGIAACGYAVAAVAWIALGDTLPGGRWFAVHLFTVGILSNLIVGLSESFGRTVLGAGKVGQRLDRFVLLNVGALTLLAFPPRLRIPFVLGAVLLLGAVIWLAVELHGLRRQAPTARFAFVVRAYEHACIAFVVGAVLGALLGTGVVPGPWYGSARMAHLHVNVLGWGGLTLLATAVFLGPAMLRMRMTDAAERHGRRALLIAPAGLAAAVIAMGSGPGPLAGARAAAAGAGLAAYAIAAGMVAWPLLRGEARGARSTHALMIRASVIWFTLTVAAGAAITATGHLRLLNVLGAVLIAGVLGQAIMAALSHLTPSVWGSSAASRTALRERMDAFAVARTAVLNLGVVAILAGGVLGPAARTASAVLTIGGWTAVSLAILSFVALSLSAMAPALSPRSGG
jgi:hypothetical protein